jgi:hypothetical protein
MIPHLQEIKNFKNGDCFRACVASILHVDVGDVINFMEEGEDRFFDLVSDYNKQEPHVLIDLTASREVGRMLTGVLCIATGTSPRNDKHNHSVVWKGEMMVHDPHPSGDGITGDPKLFTVVIPKDMGKLKQWNF